MKRELNFAGTWYSNNIGDLNNQITNLLLINQEKCVPNGRVIISPHAGYMFSGDIAATGYVSLQKTIDNIDNIFILGPLHNYHIDSCCLSTYTSYDTPFGELNINKSINNSLKNTKQFIDLDHIVDKNEHSIELQLPFIKNIVKSKNISIIPIYVGNINSFDLYGDILVEYINNPRNFFVLSSDFCHWGMRFQFIHLDFKYNQETISDTIKKLDMDGINNIIKKINAYDSFNIYINNTGNTICGKNGILILLNAIEKTHLSFDRYFIKYSQSNIVNTLNDSSVSYASIVFSL